MDLYDLTVPTFQRCLHAADGWIAKGIAHAGDKKFDPEVLFAARLAPDQYPLSRQITAACDAAKWAAAKLAGVEGPSHPDTEKNLDELRQRIRTCQAYLETFRREQFEGAEERRCQHMWMQGKWLPGRDYVPYVALPNFYFHLTHAYAILRHNGVPLDKIDYLSDVPFRD